MEKRLELERRGKEPAQVRNTFCIQILWRILCFIIAQDWHVRSKILVKLSATVTKNHCKTLMLFGEVKPILVP